MTPSDRVPTPVQRDFEDFFEHHAGALAAVVALATGDVGLAEDAIQEAMTRASNDWPRVGAMARPDLWVLRVAQRQAIDAWRRRRREVSLELADMASVVPDEILRLWVRWGLERLTPEDRLLLILRHRDGLSVDEVAALAGKSPHTASNYLKRARRRLRALLGGTTP
jgi:RNA polymerase sigma-70 factor (ECF subfamily)